MAASMQETFQKLAARYRGKANQLFVIGMGILLVLRVGLFLMEANYMAPQRVEPGEAEIKTALQPGSPDVEAVIHLTQPMPEFGDSEFLTLGKFNMFDPKQVIQGTALEKQASEKYTEAMQAFAQGKLDDAKRAVDDALGIKPSHANAKKLKEQILQQLKKAESVPAAATPAAGATPPAPTPNAPVPAPAPGSPASPPAAPAPAG
jgi:hypothetical protein